jgi:hypothetical protein
VRVVGTLIIIILAGIPALFAGAPQLAPEVFLVRVAGVPLGVGLMCLLMLVFVALAGVCSAAAGKSAGLRNR